MNHPRLTLAAGQGRGSTPSSPTSSPIHTPATASFAPHGPSTLQSRIRDKLPQPLRVRPGQHGPAARIHSACSVWRAVSICCSALMHGQRAVNSRLGRADNQRFLEHFRYLIVASQLLNEPERLRAAAIPQFTAAGPPTEFQVATISVTGATLTGTTAFTLVWLIHWSRQQAAGFSWSRFSLVVTVFVVVATACYAYVRRQWLHFLRQHAVEGASTLVTNLQAFEASTSSALALIQEVELVSRGYRLCVNILPKHSATPLTSP